MHTGRILFYLPGKGFGYLRLEGTQEEFHFRTRNVRATSLKKGDLVTFKLREGKQGYFADEIKRAMLA